MVRVFVLDSFEIIEPQNAVAAVNGSTQPRRFLPITFPQSVDARRAAYRMRAQAAGVLWQPSAGPFLPP